MKVIGYLVDVRDTGRVLRARINRQACVCGHHHKSAAAEACAIRWLRTAKHNRAMQEIELVPSVEAIRQAMQALGLYQSFVNGDKLHESTTGSISLVALQTIFRKALQHPDFNRLKAAESTKTKAGRTKE